MINTDPNHKHVYDAQGRMVCCSLEEKIHAKTEAEIDDHGHDHSHAHASPALWKEYLPAIISFVLLMTGIVMDEYIQPSFFKNYIRLSWYIVAYLPVGIPVLREAIRAIGKGEFFTEFLLMSLATIGAFVIEEYPEGVAVMLFYTVGELFQSAAVKRAKKNIKALLDIRPDKATVIRGDKTLDVTPEQIQVNEFILVKAGEKVALDGILESEGSAFNTAALTGESNPQNIEKGQEVLAGMINMDKVATIKVTKPFKESSIARILDLVQNATSKKAPTELFIRKFSKIYTPVVVFLAIGVVFIPYFFVKEYNFSEWLYRALIFLVISCPCALVISIPLGYFGGIGAASRKGILFKGSDFLDRMTKVNTVVMDKTGTLTKGVFKVQEIKPTEMQADTFLAMVAALENKSTHPIAKAVVEESKGTHEKISITTIEEISGHGLKGIYDGKELLAGNTKLLKKFNINYPAEVDSIVDTIIVVSLNKTFAGYITIADEIKEDAAKAIDQLRQLHIKPVMLSGDKQSVVDKVSKQLNIDEAYGNLLPQDKVQKVEAIKANKNNVVAFVGDGINDAPVLALSDVGMAMGGLGSDAAIETADVVIQTDQPTKIVTAINIGKATKRIVWQNISMAFGVKVIVLSLGAGGIATMWEAVFADVGVALLAVLNAIRIQRMKF